MPLSSKELLTMATAAVGAGLGVFNTFYALARNRVRLKISAKRADVEGLSNEDMACIEITNLSSFAVTIREIGFTDGSNPKKHARFCVADPIVYDDKRFPRRLEPRQSVSGYLRLKSFPPELKKAYATTDCAVTAFAKGKILTDVTYVRYRSG